MTAFLIGAGVLLALGAHGTTAMELKTGYGLSLEAELRQARLARSLAEAVDRKSVV